MQAQILEHSGQSRFCGGSELADAMAESMNVYKNHPEVAQGALIEHKRVIADHQLNTGAK